MIEKTLSIKTVVNGLKSLGIKKGDIIMVHSAYSCISAMEKGAEGLVMALEEVVGDEGTLVMPVFNWDILHQGSEIIYDVKNTPSRMGYLTEYFRTRKGTVVTRNLFNPLAVAGSLSEQFLNCPNHTSWGEDSPFKILYDNNATILMIGVDYNVVTMFHVAEAMFGVPYRFVYEFPNAFLIDESGEKRPVKNSTLRRYDGYPTDFNLAEEIIIKNDIVNEIELGDSITRALDAKKLVDCIINELSEDNEFLIKKEISRKWVATRKKGTFYSKDLIHPLWLKNRTLVSSDYDWSLSRLTEYIPLEIKSYPTGMKVWDWTIPEKWSNNGGKIFSENGEILFDLSEHPLHIAAGSIPFKDTIDRQELLQHIKTDPERPEAIPYHTLYYDNDWAVCLPHNAIEKLDGEFFNVELNCNRSEGQLKIGECIIEGKTKESIIIPIHLDHPGQCNDNLSGVVTAVALILKLLKMSEKLKYTLRFVFLPETIGVIVYLSQNENLISTLKWGIVFDSVGTSNDLMFMKSLNSNTQLDICTKLAFKKLVPKYSEHTFLEIEGYGNDERILQLPGIETPSISISRFPFKEYHSSLDNPDIISPKSINEVRDLVYEILRTINFDFIPVRKYKGIPQLSKIDELIKAFVKDPKTKRAIHRFFFLIDGQRSVSQLAIETDMSFDFTYNFMLGLKKNGKIDSIEV